MPDTSEILLDDPTRGAYRPGVVSVLGSEALAAERLLPRRRSSISRRAGSSGWPARCGPGRASNIEVPLGSLEQPPCELAQLYGREANFRRFRSRPGSRGTIEVHPCGVR
jgi:hypothetical protein